MAQWQRPLSSLMGTWVPPPWSGQPHSTDGQMGAIPLEWPALLQVSGVGSPHTLALL